MAVEDTLQIAGFEQRGKSVFGGRGDLAGVLAQFGRRRNPGQGLVDVGLFLGTATFFFAPPARIRSA